MHINIRVQTEDFSLQAESEALQLPGTGAVETYSRLVRDHDADSQVHGLLLEHYPGMTEKSLQEIATQAGQRWPLSGITIIHRIGRLMATEQIVFVGVSSAHRNAAFAACAFVMDFLKTKAPFWKKSIQANGEFWVEAKDSDTEASRRW